MWINLKMQFIPGLQSWIFSIISLVFSVIQKSFLYSVLICCSQNIIILLNIIKLIIINVGNIVQLHICIWFFRILW